LAVKKGKQFCSFFAFDALRGMLEGMTQLAAPANCNLWPATACSAGLASSRSDQPGQHFTLRLLQS